MDKRRLRIYLPVVLAVLVLAGISLVTFVPKFGVFTNSYGNNSDHYEYLEPGDDLSVSFVAPCERITGLDVDLAPVSSYDDPIGRISAGVVITGPSGEVISEQSIASLYEERFNFKELKLSRGDRYTLTFTLEDISEEMKSVGVGVSQAGELSYQIHGSNFGAPSKSMFIGVYIIFSLLLMLFIYRIPQTDPGTIRLFDRLFFAVAVIMALIFVNQMYDLFMIGKSGLRMIEAFKEGHPLDYYDLSYGKEITNNSPSMFFGYNYNVFLILPVAILMIPVSFFADGNITYDMTGYLIVLYLNVIVAALLILSIKLNDKIGDSCDMPDDYKRSVRYVYAFSPLLMYITVAFGQVDIMYVILMQAALPFYYRGKYKTFSLIMAFAAVMKLIPLMVFIPLILLVNKKIKDIAVNVLICLSVKIFTLVLFEHGDGYHAVMNLIDGWHSFTGKLFEAGTGGQSLFVILFGAVCILCFMKDIDLSNRSDLLYHSMLVIFAVYGVFTAFVDWHPQWLIPLILSASFLIPFHASDIRIPVLYSVLEILMIFSGEYDLNAVYMVETGLMSFGNNYGYNGVSITGVLNNITPFAIPLVNSLMAVTVLFLIAFFCKRPNSSYLSGKASVYAEPLSVGRIFVLYALLIFSFWCYSYVG